MYPDLIGKLVFIASNARQSAWAIAFNESQRMAIEADPEFFSDDPAGGSRGLEAARSIALLSYRNNNTYNLTQSEETDSKLGEYRASSYQNYQGLKLAKRFNAWSYYRLTQLSDSHNVGRGRYSVENALGKIKAHTLCIGISSDILFPPEEQRFVADHVRNGHFVEIDSFYGHDGFLVETEKVSQLVKEFMIAKINKTRPVPDEVPA
jgi:homoserine O-acetyltransferase